MTSCQEIIKKTSNDGQYVLQQITKDKLEDALHVIRIAFFPYENVSRASDVPKHPAAMKELEELCLRAAKDGVSVMAIEKRTGKAVSAFFNKIQVASSSDEPNYFEMFEAKCKEPSSKRLVRYMIDVEAKFDIFQAKNVTCGLEMMFGATLPEHRRRQLGTQLCALSMEIAQRLKRGDNVKVSLDAEPLPLEPQPQIVMALATSNYTKRFAEKLNFETLLEVPFNEFDFLGRKFSDVIGPETPSSTFICYVLK